MLLSLNHLKRKVFVYKNIIPPLETDMDDVRNVRVSNLKATNIAALIADITTIATINR